jgi:hypothetical protein
MQRRTAKAAKAKQAARRPDPRLAAFARLLARHAARQDFEKELSRNADGAYPADPPAGDAPEDLP